MAHLHTFLPTLLRFEGGFVDDPIDPGGATNKGITYATLHRYAKPLLGVSPSLELLRNLNEKQAAKIYKVEYWDRIFGDDIAHQPLADIVFDFYVNAGAHAIVCLYRVLNAAGATHAVQTVLTQEAIASLHAHDPIRLYNSYKELRRSYYISLVHEHPALRRFLKGWLARVDAFPTLTPSTSATNTNTNACASTSTN